MEFQKPCKVRRVKVRCGKFFGSSEAIRYRNTPRTILVCAILPLFVFFQFPAFGADGPTAKVAIPEQERPGATILPDGTPVELRITKRLSTAEAKVGDLVEFEVAHDVKVGDLVVIPRHALASGAVAVVKPRRRPLRNAELRVNVRTTESITGSEVAIRGTRVIVGNFKYDPDAAGILLSPVIPFMKGDDAFVSKARNFRPTSAEILPSIPFKYGRI
jgi:hypothetical protein